MIQLSEHFSSEEFACRCGECDLSNPANVEGKVSPKLISVLEEIRADYKRPMTVVSGLRCPKHNIKEGGLPNSTHMTGLAADIVCGNSKDRYFLEMIAYTKGIRRMGEGQTFVHLDVATEPWPQDVKWRYDG